MLAELRFAEVSTISYNIIIALGKHRLHLVFLR